MNPEEGRPDPDIADLVPGFLENRRRDVVFLRASAQRRDFPSARRIGHRMKGMGAAYGFPAIGRIGAALEQAARERDAGGVLRETDQLHAFLERMEAGHAW